MNRHPEGFQEEVVSWKATVLPLISPGLDCAVWGRSWLHSWEIPWAVLGSPEARRASGGEPRLHACVLKHPHCPSGSGGGPAASHT